MVGRLLLEFLIFSLPLTDFTGEDFTGDLLAPGKAVQIFLWGVWTLFVITLRSRHSFIHLSDPASRALRSQEAGGPVMRAGKLLTFTNDNKLCRFGMHLSGRMHPELRCQAMVERKKTEYVESKAWDFVQKEGYAEGASVPSLRTVLVFPINLCLPSF